MPFFCSWYKNPVETYKQAMPKYRNNTSEYHSPKLSSFLLERPRPVSFFTSFFLAEENLGNSALKQL